MGPLWEEGSLLHSKLFDVLSFGPILGLVLVLGVTGCSSINRYPCTEGGQPVRDLPYGSPPFRGTKSCFQRPDGEGGWVNDGKYLEKYPSEKIAVTGEYRMGKKNGRWIEYDEKGKKTSDRYFENGKEVPAP